MPLAAKIIITCVTQGLSMQLRVHPHAPSYAVSTCERLHLSDESVLYVVVGYTAEEKEKKEEKKRRLFFVSVPVVSRAQCHSDKS